MAYENILNRWGNRGYQFGCEFKANNAYSFLTEICWSIKIPLCMKDYFLWNTLTQMLNMAWFRSHSEQSNWFWPYIRLCLIVFHSKIVRNQEIHGLATRKVSHPFKLCVVKRHNLDQQFELEIAVIKKS